MIACLKDIQEGKPTKVPKYDFVTNSRKKDEWTVIYPSDVVLLEGILIFYHKDVREMFDMKLFVDTDADTRLARRGECRNGRNAGWGRFPGLIAKLKTGALSQFDSFIFRCGMTD